jgi:hypothetical protein
MRYITFCVGIKRRKVDEHRSEIFISDHVYCPGFNRCGRPDGGTALIPSGEFLLPRTSRHIVIESAKVFCIFVNFSFFVIDVMLLTLC